MSGNVVSGDEVSGGEVTVGQRLRYRVLTGPDDAAFCERVSAALEEGYQLHGGPTLTYDGERVIVGQALVLDRVAPPLGAGFATTPAGTEI